MPENPSNFNIDNVRVAKIPGNAVGATHVVKGVCLTRSVAGTIKEVNKAKIVVYGIPLDSVRPSGDVERDCPCHLKVARAS